MLELHSICSGVNVYGQYVALVKAYEKEFSQKELLCDTLKNCNMLNDINIAILRAVIDTMHMLVLHVSAILLLMDNWLRLALRSYAKIPPPYLACKVMGVNFWSFQMESSEIK